MPICKTCSSKVSCGCNMKNGNCPSCYAKEQDELKKVKDANPKTK